MKKSEYFGPSDYHFNKVNDELRGLETYVNSLLRNKEGLQEHNRKLEDRLSRNRGYATFYRDKGLRIMRHNRKLEAVVEEAKELRIQMLAMKKEFLSSNPTRQEKIMAGVFSKWIGELDALADLDGDDDSN